MRRLVPDVEQVALADTYRGLTLTDGIDPASSGGQGARRAWVALGMVASLDGAAAVDGVSRGLGSAPDKVAFDRLRGSCDAILVGAGTVRLEHYRPPIGTTARQTDRVERGLAPTPRLVIVTHALRLPADLEVFADPAERPLVVTHGNHPSEQVEQLARLADIVQLGTDQVDLRATLEELARRELGRVLCEGGPRLAGSLLELDLIDELFTTLAPTLVGGTGTRIVASRNEFQRAMELVELHEHDAELLLRYRRRPGSDDGLRGSGRSQR